MKRRSTTPRLEPLESRPLTSFTGPGLLPGSRPGPAYLVVCEGNSLTVGRGSDVPQTESYPAQLQARLGQGSKVLNLAISGQTTEQMVARNQAAFARVAATLAQLPNTVHHWSIDVVWEGTNSLRLYRNGQSAALNMRKFVALRHGQQLKVIVLTCLPADNPKEVNSQFETQRKIYNSLIRKNIVGADLVLDAASEPRLMDPHSSAYAKDHFHLSQEGYAIVSAMVSQAVQRLQKLPPAS